jgi:hypothetical protein
VHDDKNYGEGRKQYFRDTKERGALMITENDTLSLRGVLEAIRDLAAGRKTLDDLTISTTEKITVYLACDLVPTFCKDEKDAWERLNKLQRRAVATINPKFQAKAWAEIPVYFG